MVPSPVTRARHTRSRSPARSRCRPRSRHLRNTLPRGGPQLYDFETDEEAIQPEGAPPVGDTDDDFEALGPAEEEAPYLEEEPYAAEEPHAGAQPPAEEAYEGGSPEREGTYEEEEEDDLWFEKGPPQDFDFEDEER